MQIIKIHAGDIVATSKFSLPALYYGKNVDFNFLYNDDDKSAYYVIHSKAITDLIMVSFPGSRGLLDEFYCKTTSNFYGSHCGKYNENY